MEVHTRCLRITIRALSRAHTSAKAQGFPVTTAEHTSVAAITYRNSPVMCDVECQDSRLFNKDATNAHQIKNNSITCTYTVQILKTISYVK